LKKYKKAMIKKQERKAVNKKMTEMKEDGKRKRG
jgi:hypothetical protein